MDITNLLSILQNSNINLGDVISTVSKIFSPNISTATPAPSQQTAQNYYNLPNYDFGTKNDSFGSTMQGTMQCIAPKQTPISSQKSQNNNIAAVLELAQTLLPLLTQKQQNQPVKTAQKTAVQQQNYTPSQIKKLTKIANNN